MMQATMVQNDVVEPRGGGETTSPFSGFPEDCISKIISFTSPREACVVASVSKTFEAAVKSDIVWEKFLPLDLVPQWRHLSSKKELYFALCDHPVLIDHGRKSIWLEKATGKRCIMLSAMDLAIVDSDDPEYWDWITIPESRFECVAELQHTYMFQIRGRMNTRFLSPRTRYSAYVVFKRWDQCHGFGCIPIEARVGVVGEEACTRLICFDGREGPWRDLVKPNEREDGWMEIGLGEFYNEGGLMSSNEIKMSALEREGRSWKRGLIIQGIEFRPSRS